MRVSIRFYNFAVALTGFFILSGMVSCKGRTTGNMVPDGDTIEVVIMQPLENDTNNLIQDQENEDF
ncbi:MAG: hypothetical protein J1E78_00360 [Muribaculaceae bacterium]|nr:hypothetical protein [Muribaculaceae bacterium]